jgi:riboflavin transporter FmnP
MTVIFTQIKIPAPYAPYLMYQIWEIPIVAAFLLIGYRYGLAIAGLNSVALLIIFPGALLFGPFYNLIAVTSMLIGVYIVQKFTNRKKSQRKEAKTLIQYTTIIIAVATTLAIVFRVVVMTAVNYTVLRFPPPIGYSLMEEAIVLSLPVTGFFNATLALYTIPLSYLIAKTISTNIKIN